MIINLIDREKLFTQVKDYIDEVGTLDGAEDTQHILDLIENAETLSTWVVKP